MAANSAKYSAKSISANGALHDSLGFQPQETRYPPPPGAPTARSMRDDWAGEDQCWEPWLGVIR